MASEFLSKGSLLSMTLRDSISSADSNKRRMLKHFDEECLKLGDKLYATKDEPNCSLQQNKAPVVLMNGVNPVQMDCLGSELVAEHMIAKTYQTYEGRQALATETVGAGQPFNPTQPSFPVLILKDTPSISKESISTCSPEIASNEMSRSAEKYNLRLVEVNGILHVYFRNYHIKEPELLKDVHLWIKQLLNENDTAIKKVFFNGVQFYVDENGFVEERVYVD